MYLIPYAKVTLRSSLPPQAFADRLSQLVVTPTLLRWPWDACDEEFQGDVVGRDFRLSRVRRLQVNSFFTEGRIDPADGGGCSVNLVIRPYAHAAVGLAVVAAMVLGFAIAAAVSKLARGTSNDYLSWSTFAVFVYFTTVVLFFLEVRKTLRFLAPLGERVDRRIEE